VNEAMSSLPGEPRPGSVAAAVATELPGLALLWLPATVAPGPSPAGLRSRLRDLSNRRRGVDAIALRTRPLPRAYRAFYRQIGLDPDIERIPAERAAVDRLMHGAFRSAGRVADACLLALVETAVGVWALDAAAVGSEGPEIRLDDGGGLVVAGPGGVLAPLFGDPEQAVAPGPRTRSLVLYAIAVPGVPEIHLDEALWLAADALESG
jgi:DNA/RNA-binding domain of Phe-tRNA-synthetase-like protein